MLKRYIGNDEVTVTLAGQDFGTVSNGDSIPVPDELANSLAWPEGLWEDVNSSKTDDEDDNDNDGENN